MPRCEVCKKRVHDEKYVGCCRDGECPNHVEAMCNACATWDKEKGVWLCPKCVSN